MCFHCQQQKDSLNTNQVAESEPQITQVKRPHKYARQESDQSELGIKVKTDKT